MKPPRFTLSTVADTRYKELKDYSITLQADTAAQAWRKFCCFYFGKVKPDKRAWRIKAVK